MNKKRTNYLIAISNFIIIGVCFLFEYSLKYIMSGVLIGEDIFKSIYNNPIIDFLLNKFEIMSVFVYGEVAIINIIAAIQNNKNKKLSFWQLIFSINYICCVLEIIKVIININVDILNWINIILLGIVPISYALINIILIKKNKLKVIELILYFILIVLSILGILEIIDYYLSIFAVIMQIMYTYFQEKNISESKLRKNINIFLYYGFQLILTTGIVIIILVSLLITKVNNLQFKKELLKVYDNITMMQESKNKEIYVPVEKNYKYGFINENGEEKISCEYDRVSYFNEIEIDNIKYYVALAEKDSKFYIISKSNERLLLNSILEECLKMAYKFRYEQEEQRSGYYVRTFEMLFITLNSPMKMELKEQIIVEKKYYNNNVKLKKSNNKYYYDNENFSMIIEPTEDYNREQDKTTYYDKTKDAIVINSENKMKCNITITKSNGEKSQDTVYLPGLSIEYGCLDVFLNGYIEFENEEGTQIGWYDSNGNKNLISSEYAITDIEDDKILLRDKDKNGLSCIIVDIAGNKLLETDMLIILENLYLIKNKNEKIILIDDDLNVITSEYDRIILNGSLDYDYN